MKNVEINSLDHYGRGICKIDNKVVFVENALVGEVVDINIVKDYKNYSIANVTKYHKYSNYRREVPCKYYNVCGGCNIMHMTYEEQLKFKTDKVKNILKKYSKKDIDPIIIESNNEIGYRNKVTLHNKNNKIGYYEKNTNSIVNIDKCLLLEEPINNEIKQVKKTTEEIIIRSNERKAVIANYNDKDIIKTIKGFKFKVNINSFFQVNDYICSKIFEIIDENINNKDKVLDLYSGVGTLGIVASKKALSVTSVESNNNACKNMVENIILNHINNLRVIISKVEDSDIDYKSYNTIIIDPPRSGLKKNVVELINQSNCNKVIYISCNPMTLARDLNYLNNYNIRKSYVLDMFPNTYHVETVVILEKNQVEEGKEK